MPSFSDRRVHRRHLHTVGAVITARCRCTKAIIGSFLLIYDRLHARQPLNARYSPDYKRPYWRAVRAAVGGGCTGVPVNGRRAACLAYWRWYRAPSFSELQSTLTSQNSQPGSLWMMWAHSRNGVRPTSAVLQCRPRWLRSRRYWVPPPGGQLAICYGLSVVCLCSSTGPIHWSRSCRPIVDLRRPHRRGRETISYGGGNCTLSGARLVQQQQRST
jgi:hypothetical protein